MIYAESSALRTRQLLGDALLLAWVSAWLQAGRWVGDQVQRLGTPPEQLGEAGRRIEDAAAGGGDAFSGIPGVGTATESLFERLGAGGTSLVDAGRTGQLVADRLALVLGLFVAAVPIVWLIARRVPARIRWAKEATAARRIRDLPGTEDLFALRALAHAPLADLRKQEPDPMAAFRDGRTSGLAELELRRLGLLPTSPA